MSENGIFKALSDATRRQILEILAKEGPLPAGEIASRFDMSAPSISHHLSILRHAGLVDDTRQKQAILYSLNPGVLAEVDGWLRGLLGPQHEE